MNKQVIHHDQVSVGPVICVLLWFEVITRKRFGIEYIWRYTFPGQLFPMAVMYVILQGYWPLKENICMFLFSSLFTVRFLWNLSQSHRNRLLKGENYIHTMNTGQPFIDSEFFDHLLIRRWIEPLLWLITGIAITSWTAETTFGSFVSCMAVVGFIKEQRLRKASEATYKTLADQSQTANAAEEQLSDIKGRSKDKDGFFEVE